MGRRTAGLTRKPLQQSGLGLEDLRLARGIAGDAF
jgi:hypothetical protein